MIFSGTWQPPGEPPFMPGAYAHRSTGTGQTAARRYFGHTNWTWRRPHVEAMRKAEFVWRTILTEQQKYIWLVSAENMENARDFPMDLAGKPFVAFAMANWPYFFANQGPTLFGGAAEGNALQYANLQWVWPEEQSAGVYLQYEHTPWNTITSPTATWIYQIDPARIGSTREQRFTRYAGHFWDWELAIFNYYYTISLPFGISENDQLRLVFRHRRGFYWQESIVTSYIES